MTSRENHTLLTDLYQLTMAQGYFREQRLAEATFSLFIRSYPPNRGYFVSAGLQDVLDYLENFSFDNAALDYLAAQKLFTEDFLHYLADLKFAGEVWAIPEGRIFFKDEPVLEVTAPVIQGQIAETFIINQVHLQSMIATKAARCVHAAGGRPVVDFALRRTHGSDAGMKVARASYLAGFAGTSNVMAGKNYGMPIVGTMAHSFVMSFEREIDAFRAYAASFPRATILLIDTYDTLVGAHNAATVGKEMAERGEKLIGVRIDSGDLPAQAHAVREILDKAGLAAGQNSRQRRLGRIRSWRVFSSPSALRQLRRRHQDGHLGRRAVDRHVVQAGRIRRPASAKTQHRKNFLAGKETNISPPRRRRQSWKRCHRLARRQYCRCRTAA